ncbi:molybdopterin-dependent oxidoreductase [Nocardia sp. NPDC050712]|uniref:molybdopterin-dependent oxidoreductase n=1 Tax=Nocardia sp. NPDC050712 TaxID=3155518 RepID=UPI00340468AA
MRTEEDRNRGGVAGAAAVGVAALGLGEAIAAARGGSLIDTIGRALIDTVPIPVVEATVVISGRHDKAATRAGVGAGAVAATAAISALPPRLRLPGVVAAGAATAALATRQSTRSASAMLGAAAASGVLAAGLRRRPRGVLGTLGWTLAGAGLFAAAHTLQRDLDRKQDGVIRRLGAMGAPGTVPEDGLEGEAGLSALVTPEHKMYVADVSLRAPRIDPNRWRLSVKGMVAHTLRLSLADLAADAVEFDAVLVCVHNRAGEGRAGNARWLGVPLVRLLEHAIPDDNATHLVTRAVDGYTISLPLDALRSGELPGYLVVGMNGQPLSPAHGFPARVFVPGLYGQYTGAKWLSELELTDDSHSDYWVKRGWTRELLRVHPHARIDSTLPGREIAGTTSVTGVAWAPPHGVDAVEIRVGQEDWQPVELGTELSPSSWRRWRTTLKLPAGAHTIQVRAISRSGQTQDAVDRPPFPVGPTGLHTVTVDV